MNIDYRVGQSVNCGACRNDGVLVEVTGTGPPVGTGVDEMTVEHPAVDDRGEPTRCELTSEEISRTSPL